MSERKYYCFCDSNCKFETMSKEQILAAIAEATGNAVSGVDSAFISHIKETNANTDLKFWRGTMSQFNALATKDENTFYIITDDDALDSIDEKLKEFDERMSGDEKNIQSYAEKTDKIYASAKTLNVDSYSTDDYAPVTYSVDGIRVHETVHAGLYMVRVVCRAGTQTHCSFMFDFTGGENMFSSVFKYDSGKEILDAVVKAEAQGGGHFILKVVSTLTAEENGLFNISVRRIGSGYALG